MRRRLARARPLATTAYLPDRASALLAMRMVSRTAASALSARSQRSCLCSRLVHDGSDGAISLWARSGSRC